MRLKGKVALVTGAASGIGRATATLLANEGAAVVAVDVSNDIDGISDEISAAGGRCLALREDASTRDGCEAAIRAASEGFGGLDAAVHAAAISVGGTVTSMLEEDWHEVLRVDLSSAFYLGRTAVPVLSRRGRGSLVFVASQLGLVGTRGSVAYTAAKGGLINLTRSMALDHAVEGVRVNCLCPGPVETPFLRRSFGRASDPEAARNELLDRVPLGRFGRPEEIARAALFLASPESSFVTGAVLVADGGFVAQ